MLLKYNQHAGLNTTGDPKVLVPDTVPTIAVPLSFHYYHKQLLLFDCNYTIELSVVEGSNTTGDPKVILLPDTVPTTAVP